MVGGKAQTKAFRAVAANLRVTLSQCKKREDFARFGTRLDEATRGRLTRGAAVCAALRQAEWEPMSAVEQLAVLVVAMEGQFSGLSEAKTGVVIAKLRMAVAHDWGGLAKSMVENAPLTQEDRDQMIALAHTARATLGGENGATT